MKQEKKIQELESKCEEYLLGWKRAQADYQNLAKETEEKRKKFLEIMTSDFVNTLLPVIDHFEMALEYIPQEEKDKEWVKGFFHIKKQFDSFLENYGVKKIKSVGEEFNPEQHEAIAEEESEDQKGKVVKEVSCGYEISGKVIRHSKVIVSK